ncbi:hypothetical protein ACE3MZ_10755 [Paenibacillus sp. WLX1005]|uniref:hypothetical protein n=1 Tax=unclassified Paenibacillus TaxID=185978 RepID=UPI0039843076
MQRNNQSWMKRSPLAILLLLGVILLAACGNNQSQQPAAAPAENGSTSTDTEVTQPQDNTETTPADNGSTGEDNMASPETNEGTSSEGTTEGTTDTTTGDDQMATQVATGTFSGLADEHSAEVMVDGSPVVYQLDDSVRDAANKLKEGSEITFKYTEKAIPGDATTKLRTIVELESK